MKKIRIAFYKWKKTPFSKLIAWKQSRKFDKEYSQYTHCELVFWELSISSSEYDWGVRVKHIHYKKDNWDFIQIQLNNNDYKKVLDFSLSNLWSKYNWTGIFFAQVFNWNLKGNNQRFCSEYVCEALQQAKLLCGVSALFVEPAELYFRLKNK